MGFVSKGYTIKRRGHINAKREARSSLAPLLKASWKLPTNVETSNSEPHADMITTPYYICIPHSADTL